MAIREDEDVAQAMGIDLVRNKLLAFATGAALSGLAGAIFASKLTSIYPHSFNLLVSINVLAVIIVGGLGSIPGVIVGALVLVGLPELLREFAEYRLLVYGAVLVFMMLKRPEGLLPEARRKLELHELSPDVAE
jgi:branched-chain amino acid transport system permease protein